MAATVLYFREEAIRAGRATPIDAVGEYIAKLSEPLQEGLIEELAHRYGFTVLPFRGQDSFGIECLDVVARALERDPAIESVRPNSAIFTAQD